MANEHSQRMTRRKYVLWIGGLLLVLLLVSGAIFFLLFGAREHARTLADGNVPPTKTATPMATLTPQPLFAETFTGLKQGWYTGNVAGYTRIVNSNGLTLADTNHETLVESLPTDKLFSDFSITTVITLVTADANDSAGFYVRGDSNLDHDYRIEVFGNDTYAISKELLDVSHQAETITLVPATHTALLKPLGQANTLTATMNGSQITLLINGQVVTSISDTDYTRGQVALFVSNGDTSDGVTALFSSVMIYPIESGQGNALRQ